MTTVMDVKRKRYALDDAETLVAIIERCDKYKACSGSPWFWFKLFLRSIMWGWGGGEMRGVAFEAKFMEMEAREYAEQTKKALKDVEL